jgi:hypothetical protein
MHDGRARYDVLQPSGQRGLAARTAPVDSQHDWAMISASLVSEAHHVRRDDGQPLSAPRPRFGFISEQAQ